MWQMVIFIKFIFQTWVQYPLKWMNTFLRLTGSVGLLCVIKPVCLQHMCQIFFSILKLSRTAMCWKFLFGRFFFCLFWEWCFGFLEKDHLVWGRKKCLQDVESWAPSCACQPLHGGSHMSQVHRTLYVIFYLKGLASVCV